MNEATDNLRIAPGRGGVPGPGPQPAHVHEAFWTGLSGVCPLVGLTAAVLGFWEQAWEWGAARGRPDPRESSIPPPPPPADRGMPEAVPKSVPVRRAA